MKRDDVPNHVGKNATLNGWGDLAMEGTLKLLIREKTVLKIIKLTRGGMVLLKNEENNKTYSVPPKNVDLLRKEIKTMTIPCKGCISTEICRAKYVNSNGNMARIISCKFYKDWFLSRNWFSITDEDIQKLYIEFLDAISLTEEEDAKLYEITNSIIMSGEIPHELIEDMAYMEKLLSDVVAKDFETFCEQQIDIMSADDIDIGNGTCLPNKPM